MFEVAKYRRTAFTLMEVMTATAITLILMGLVVQIFAMVGDTVSDTRSTIQMVDRLRATRQTLQSDLAGVTCAGMTPPLDPEQGFGYLEVIEGPIGSRFFPSAAPMAIANGSGLSVGNAAWPGDSTLGDIDDMVMFTTTTQGDPFVGKWQSPVTGIVVPTTSHVAEVCYFMRGTTLYRRVLLVKPAINVPTRLGFYGTNDISVHQEGGAYDYSPNPAGGGTPPPARLVPNSLSDLTNRKNRYGHQPFAFPYDARFWGPLGLPTLRECSFYQTIGGVNVGTWPFPLFDPANYANTWGTASPYAPAGVSAGSLVFPTPPAGTNQASLVPTAANWPKFPQIPQVNLTLTAGGVFDAWQTPYPWDQTSYPLNTTTVNPASPYVGPNGAIYAFSASNTPPALQPSNNMRYSEDVILTNVLSFDVKVWDPNAPVVAHPGIDGGPGFAGVDDDADGVVDDLSELGAAGSDDLVWQPGDVYPDAMLPAALQGYSTYNYSSGLSSLNNWANSQYLLAYAMTKLPTPTAWVIQRGAYVDMAYAQNPSVGATFQSPHTVFCGPGDFRSLLWAGGSFNGNFYVMPAVYDTGSRGVEDDGLDEDLVFVTAFNSANGTSLSSYGADQGINHIDENNCYGPDDSIGEQWSEVNNNGLYDPSVESSSWNDINLNKVFDPPEKELPPPYAIALGGIQIKIRVFDPDSRQIREVTVVQEFENE